MPTRMNRAAISPEDSLIFMSGSFFGLWFGAGFKSRNGLRGRKTSTTWLGRIECIARNFRRGSGNNIAHPWPLAAENYEAQNEPSADRLLPLVSPESQVAYFALAAAGAASVLVSLTGCSTGSGALIVRVMAPVR